VIDTNNYYPQRDGSFAALDEGRTTSSEMLQEHLPGSRVVKAFNTMQAARLRSSGRPSGDPARLGIPIAGNEKLAKQAVAGLIDQVGYDAVDFGDLAAGRRLQPGSAVYAAGLTGAELRRRLAA
jgi:predicted dinucleotide-binding enzyme